jgi:RNA polymerase sigma-70 factor, ECF subfamily
MDEREAIQRLKRGDISGLEALVRRYQLAAMRAAYLVTRERALAEDLVQSAFLKVYDRIDQFDAARPFGAWFYTTILRDAIKAARHRARASPIDRLRDLRGDLPHAAHPPTGRQDRRYHHRRSLVCRR